MNQNKKFSDWHDVYYNEENGYARKVQNDMNDYNLFNICANMLRELNDPHVGLFTPLELFAASYHDLREIFDLSKVRKHLYKDGSTIYKNFLYGKLEEYPQIGYIHLSSLTPEAEDSENKDWGKNIDNIINDLSDTKAIIFDIRNNKGGDIFISEYIAARFTSVQRDYMKSGIKNGTGLNDISEFKYYRVKPAGVRYTKPVILLTNKGTTSAAEWLTMALLTQNNITHTGSPTCGAFSMRVKRPMINGWYYTISVERVMDMNGNIYEGIGISPNDDHIIKNNQDDPIDEQLFYAIELAKKNWE